MTILVVSLTAFITWLVAGSVAIHPIFKDWVRIKQIRHRLIARFLGAVAPWRVMGIVRDGFGQWSRKQVPRLPVIMETSWDENILRKVAYS